MTTHNNIQIIMNNQILMRNKIAELRQQIDNIETLLEQSEFKLWRKCKHEWKRDYSCMTDDPIKYYCIHCKLWNDPRRYDG